MAIDPKYVGFFADYMFITEILKKMGKKIQKITHNSIRKLSVNIMVYILNFHAYTIYVYVYT